MDELDNKLFNKSLMKKYAKDKAFKLTVKKHSLIKEHIEKVEKGEFKSEVSSYLYFYDFLKDILGYDREENILFDEKEDIGLGKSEFALKSANKKKFMVIELKDQDTDLDKKQNRPGDKRTPVDQAFTYSQHSGDVDWILVSNFKEFRLYNYKKKSHKCIRFTCEDLLNKEKFSFFMLSFSKKSHLEKKYPSKLLKDTVVIEKKLEENFYKLYHETRLMLIKELEEINGLERSKSLHYAQLILNRYMFICFAEDMNLLPPQLSINTIVNPIKSKTLRKTSIWYSISNLFIDLNEGNPERDVFEYNGGLFTEELENKMEIRDIVEDPNFFTDTYQGWIFNERPLDIESLVYPYQAKINPIYKNLLTISSFDFSSELDVNILGHIFENSIGDLEELKEGSKGRRKKEGIYYTPDYITDYICRNTIIPYLSKSGKYNTVKDLVGEYWGSQIRDLDEKVKNIKIIDPACGSGAFLNRAADVLLEIQEAIHAQLYAKDKSLDKHIDSVEKRSKILLENVYGVDLNEESTEITKLALFLNIFKKAKHPVKLPKIDSNIMCGNSLIDDKDVVGGSAFNWNENFKDIIDSGGFDIVIGNPPYIDSETMVKEIPNEREFISDNYKTAKGNWDIYIPFYELAYKICNENGFISFITPNKWLSINYGKALRKMIGEQLIKVCDCSNVKVFKDAGNTPVIAFIKKEIENDIVENYYLTENLKFKNSINVPISILIETDNWGLLFSNNLDILLKINETETKVSDVGSVENPFTVSEAYEFIPFLFDCEDINKRTKLKFINTGTITPYSTLWGIKKTAYIKNKYKYPFVDEEGFQEAMPNRFQQSKSKKIIIKGIRHFESFLDFNGEYVAGKSTIIIKDEEENFPLELLMCFLNSNVINFYIKEAYSALGIDGGINFTSPLVKKLPLIRPTNNVELIDYSLKLLKLNEDKNREIIKFKDWLEDAFGLETSSKKIDHYYNLTIKELITELKKKNVDSKSRKNYTDIKKGFTESTTILNPINTEIIEIEEEINRLIYGLYNLNEKEITIIEGSL